MNDHRSVNDELFRLRVRLGRDVTLAVTAWEGKRMAPNHTRIDVRARLYFHNGIKRTYADIFRRGDTWCGIPSHQTIDGKAARECVLSLLAMRPGDTDSEYFDSYTPEQLEFAGSYGEELGSVSEFRYGRP